MIMQIEQEVKQPLQMTSPGKISPDKGRSKVLLFGAPAGDLGSPLDPWSGRGQEQLLY